MSSDLETVSFYFLFSDSLPDTVISARVRIAALTSSFHTHAQQALLPSFEKQSKHNSPEYIQKPLCLSVASCQTQDVMRGPLLIADAAPRPGESAG